MAVAATGLLALAWGGVNHLLKPRHELAARPLGPSLTEHFAAMVYSAERPLSPAAGPPAAVSGAGPPRLPAEPGPPPDQEAEYEARRAKTPLELQKFRRTSSIRVRGAGGREGVAVLVDLNPRIHDGYVLVLRWSDGEETRLHLENARPDLHRLDLDPAYPSGLVIAGPGAPRPCDLWSELVPGRLREIEKSERPYTGVCDGDVLVRHRTQGSRTAREWAAEFLRSNVSGGEALTSLVKETVYPDAFLERAELAAGAEAAAAPIDGPGAPPPALVSAAHRGDRLVARDLGIPTSAREAMVAGRWYPAAGVPGVFVSLMTAGRVAPEVVERSRVRDLDAVERDGLVYLVAFDLGRFDLGYALGTDNPGVGWSDRVPDSVREPSLPGPDGFDDLSPLEPTGMVPPQDADRVVATFAGGFKRLHGAFHAGALARVNSGSHYGFVEDGVVLSKLQPGLATLFALDDGDVRMKTWSRADDALLERVRSARQNGVPILERDPQTGTGVTGALVGRWSEGNWGGSQEARLRSVRAGTALLESAGRRYLLFGYFSSATPSAMAVVFAAYGCPYAMHLDMNAPEHTYLALYRAGEGALEIRHLVRIMGSLDKTSGGTTVPRFLGYADSRDFFYLTTKRRAPPAAPAAEDLDGPPAAPPLP